MKKDDIKLKDFFVIKWQPFSSCNYNCSYCCQKIKKGFNINKILIDSKIIKNKIIDNIDKNIFLSISGGELSTLDLKSLLKVFENLKDKKINYIYIVSNFSRNSDYYNKINEWCINNNISLLLELSFHEEFISEESFFNKLKELKFEPIRIQSVVTEKNFDYMKRIKEKYNNIFFEPNIYDDLEKINFPFKKNEIKRYLIRGKKTNKYCLQYQISIKENGDVFNNNCKVKKYGNIYRKIYLPKNKTYFYCLNKRCNYSHIQEWKEDDNK